MMDALEISTSPAIVSLSEAKIAPEAIPPVPLAIVVKRAGMSYHQIWRSSDVAVYRAQGEGNRLEFEIFKIQILPAEEVNGKSYPVREAFPSSSEWGSLGFTFTNNSHSDPLAAAMAKARKISGCKPEVELQGA